MGFHSRECIACGHPLLSHWVTNETNDWMRDGVVIHRDPKQGLTKGEYDGHGRLWYSDKYRETLNIMGACDDATDGNGYGDIYRGGMVATPLRRASTTRHAGLLRASPPNGNPHQMQRTRGTSSTTTTTTRWSVPSMTSGMHAYGCGLTMT